MKNTIGLFILLIMGLSNFAQPFTVDSSFTSHFDFRSQNSPAIYDLHEDDLGRIFIAGNFQFSNGSTPHNGIVSYYRNGNLNFNYTASVIEGSVGSYTQINDSVHYLGNVTLGAFANSSGQIINQSWQTNVIASAPCIDGESFFFKDGSSLFGSRKDLISQLPCDLYIPPDTFPGNFLLKIQPNGLWDSSFNVSLTGNPRFIVEYDSNRLFIAGYPSNLTHYEGRAVKGLCRIFKNGSLDTTFYSLIKDTAAINSFTIKKIESDGSIFLVGAFYLEGYTQRFSLVKLNPDGSLNSSFMNSSGPRDTTYNLGGLNTIVKTNDGGYLVGGTFNNYQGYPIRNLAKIDSVGKVEPQYFQGLGPDSSANNGVIFSTIYSIIKSNFGGYYIAGDFLRHNGLPSQPIYRIFDSQNGVGINEVNLTNRAHKVYPNPLSETLNLEFAVNVNEQMIFRVYTIQGKLLQEEPLSPGYLHRIDISNRKQGVYFYQIQNNHGQLVSGRLMVE